MKACFITFEDAQLPALIAVAVVVLALYTFGHMSAQNAARKDPSCEWVVRDIKCLGWMFLIAIVWSLFQYFSNLC